MVFGGEQTGRTSRPPLNSIHPKGPMNQEPTPTVSEAQTDADLPTDPAADLDESDLEAAAGGSGLGVLYCGPLVSIIAKAAE